MLCSNAHTSSGDGWSARVEDSVLHGCIPLIIMDNVSRGSFKGCGGGARVMCESGGFPFLLFETFSPLNSE